MDTTTPDACLGAVAARNHGVLTQEDAAAAGLSVGDIRHRTRTGRWRRVAAGVFVVAGAPGSPEQDALAACRAGPPGTVASHLTAAALFRVWRPPPVPHVTIPPNGCARLAIALAHRSPLSPEDVAAVGVIPCTRPSRTVVDCAALLGYDALCELVDDVLCRGLARPNDVRAAMARASARPGRKGLGHLDRALEVWTPGPQPGSQGEMRLLRRLITWGFPPPERQVVIVDDAGAFVARVDLAYRARKVVLEYDGERHHGPRRWALDAARQERVEALGWTVVRVRKRDLQAGAVRVADLLRPFFP